MSSFDYARLSEGVARFETPAWSSPFENHAPISKFSNFRGGASLVPTNFPMFSFDYARLSEGVARFEAVS